MIREYRRDLQHCYLVMYSQSNNVDAGYVRRMITENKIPGLLPCSCKRIDDNILYYYDITSHISLKERLNQKKIEGEEIVLLLNSLIDLLSNIDEYLLSGNSICLELDSIFVNAKMEKISFCYFPDENEDLVKRIQRLFEELLPFLNHQRMESIQIGYDLFHYLMKTPFSLESLKEEINKVCRREIEDKEEQIMKKDIEKEEKINSDSEIDMLFCENNLENQPRLHGYIIGTSLFCIFYLFMGLYIWNSFRVYILWWGILGIVIGTFVLCSCFIWKKVSRKIVKSEDISKTEYSEWAEEETDLLVEVVDEDIETEILSMEKWNYIYILEEKYMDNPRRHELRDCEIQIIGRFHETADIVLEFPSISRVHARLRRDNTRFFLSDLNSRNGTWVNGKELVGMQEIEIRVEDEIRFAESIYRFKKI